MEMPVARVVNASPGMEGKSLYLPNIGSGGNACIEKLWHPMLSAHRQSSPWRVMGSNCRPASSFDAVTCAFFVAATLLTQLGYTAVNIPGATC